MIVPVSATNASALALLQQTQRQDFRSPFAYFESDLFSVIGTEGAIGAQVLDVFAGDFNFQKQFVEEYDRLRKEHPDMTDANAAHNATVEVITKNRDHFPAEGFAIHTELPGGGSVTTLIPPKSGHSAAFAELERTVWKQAADRAIEAQIAEAMSRAEETGVDPPDTQEIRDRLTALYLAR